MAMRRVDDRKALDEMLGSVGDSMTATVTYVTPDMELGTAARLLENAGVSGAPVVEEDRVLAVVTLQDVLSRIPLPRARAQTTGPFHRWERALNQLSLRSATLVRDVCSGQALTVSVDTPLAAAASLMAAGRVNRLPVVDSEGRLLGIVARDDVVRAVAGAHDGTAWHRNEDLLAAPATK
jgi:predicted transcriptional regulator